MTKRPDFLRSQIEAVHADGFGWALACCGGDRDLAEEALQLSYLKVLEGRARFAERSSFRTWIFGVIRLSAAELRRRRAWQRFLPFELASKERDPRPSSEKLLVTAEEVENLRRALSGLGERQRQILHLVFYQGMSVEEAAHVLGLKVGTARTHYQRGKARLRRLVEQEAA